MPNPFVYDRPLPARDLIGRRHELEQLLELAQGGHSVRLGAPRRYGKTTLLNALAAAAWDAHEMVPALVDLSGVNSIPDAAARFTRAYERGLDRGRLRRQARAILRRASASLVLGPVGATLSAAGGSGDLERLHDVLELPRHVHERTGQQCLVVLDEVQDLLSFGGGLDGLLRSHIQHHVGVATYVFAGSQPSLLAALFGDRRRPLFEQARAVALGRLPLDELGDWMAARLLATGHEALADHLDELLAFSQGHPQRAMLLAHFLYEQSSADEPLAAALELALREARDGLEATWRACSQAQRRLLGAVAAGHDRATSNAAMTATGLGKSTQAKVRDQLIAEAHLERRPDGRVVFVDPLLRSWLRRHVEGPA